MAASSGREYRYGSCSQNVERWVPERLETRRGLRGGGETEELGGEKHASEDGVVEEGEESYEELGRVGEEGVCEDGSKTGAEDVGGARVTEADRPPEGEFGRRVSIK